MQKIYSYYKGFHKNQIRIQIYGKVKFSTNFSLHKEIEILQMLGHSQFSGKFRITDSLSKAFLFYEFHQKFLITPSQNLDFSVPLIRYFNPTIKADRTMLNLFIEI